MICEAAFVARRVNFNSPKPLHSNDLSHSTHLQGLTQVFGHLHADMEGWRSCEIVLYGFTSRPPHKTP